MIETVRIVLRARLALFFVMAGYNLGIPVSIYGSTR